MKEECYPKGLAPDHTEPLNANGKVVDVPAVNVIFNQWNGKKIQNTFGVKPVVDYEGKPMFAELAIMQMVIRGGWSSRWVEVYTISKTKSHTTSQNG